MKSRRYLSMSSLLIGALLATGCMRNPVTHELQPSLISVEQEIAMGEQAAPEFERQFGGKVADPTLQGYLRGVGAKLAAVSDRQDVPYEYALLASDTPNAFALPGGKIYVTAGLMKRMNNERELAAVLAHETVHIAAMHSVQGLQRELGVRVVAELAGSVIGGTGGQAAEVGAKIAGTMVNLNYGRKDEYQADTVGIRYMTQAGYNPWGMVELLNTLRSMSDQEGGVFDEMFSTHPLPGNRIEETQDVVEKEYPQYSADTKDPRAARFLEMRRLLKR